MIPGQHRATFFAEGVFCRELITAFGLDLRDRWNETLSRSVEHYSQDFFLRQWRNGPSYLP